MNIKKELALEHSKVLTISIVNYVGNHKKRFEELMNVFLNGDYQTKQRASWPLMHVASNNPKLTRAYTHKLIFEIQNSNNHPGVIRNSLKIFETINFSTKDEVVLLDVCFSFISSNSTPIAIKAIAITIATRICKKYPELKQELTLHLIYLQNYPVAAAIRVRLKKALKELQ